MPDRFYVSPILESGTLKIEGTEAHHLSGVLRLEPGQVIEIFDGQGTTAKAEIVRSSKRSVDVQIQSVHREPRPIGEVILGTCVPKGERFDWLIEKATELGVSEVIPLSTTRSVVEPRDAKLDRLRQSVIAACKQSRRNWLLKISPVSSWHDFVSSNCRERTLFVAHPEPRFPKSTTLKSTTTTSRTELQEIPADRSIAVAVGPEGGLTDEEIEFALTHQARMIDLGPLILRIETAAIALATLTLMRHPR